MQLQSQFIDTEHVRFHIPILIDTVETMSKRFGENVLVRFETAANN